MVCYSILWSARLYSTIAWPDPRLYSFDGKERNFLGCYIVSCKKILCLAPATAWHFRQYVINNFLVGAVLRVCHLKWKIEPKSLWCVGAPFWPWVELSLINSIDDVSVAELFFRGFPPPSPLVSVKASARPVMWAPFITGRGCDVGRAVFLLASDDGKEEGWSTSYCSCV